MKKIFLHGLILSAFVSMFSVFAFAQNSRTDSKVAEMYVISAKAGGVNFTEGTVSVVRAGGKTASLIKGDNVEIGDKVITGTEARAEILLNPGSYIRLAPNSEFEFITTSLDDLKLKLTKGSAMLEVFADKEYSVLVNTPNTQFVVIKTGVYRVDVLSETSSRLEVSEGRAMANTMEVKSGRAATVINGETSVEKFDRGNKDELETWSKNRAKELVRMNQSLERRALHQTLLTGFHENMWNTFDSFGLWVRHPSMFGMYCFVPFGYGWSSPYRYLYYWNLWNLGLPIYIYNPLIVNSGQTGNGNGNNTGGGINPNTTDRTRTRPPYQTIQGETGTRTRNPMPTASEDSVFPTRQPQPTIIVPAQPANNSSNTGSRNP